MLAQVLEDLWAISPDPRRDKLTAAFITHAVALATGVAPGDIASTGRTSKAAARARQIAIYLAHVNFNWPLIRVAFAFNRDRTTCGYACTRIEEMRENAAFDERMNALEACVKQAPESIPELTQLGVER
jgi:chromosomal replication initiation ATPase DnaA